MSIAVSFIDALSDAQFPTLNVLTDGYFGAISSQGIYVAIGGFSLYASEEKPDKSLTTSGQFMPLQMLIPLYVYSRYQQHNYNMKVKLFFFFFFNGEKKISIGWIRVNFHPTWTY